MKNIIYIALICAVFLLGCNEQNKTYSIAAASVMGDLAQHFCEQCSNENATFVASIASSGVCARQIQNGSPAAVFFSAHRKWIELLAEQNLITEHSLQPLYTDGLVYIVPKNSVINAENIFDLQNTELQISCADHLSAPAGKYFKTACKNTGIWENVSDHIIQTSNVKMTLKNVEKNAVSGGIVYKSMAQRCDNVTIAFEIPRELTGKIIFYCALLKKYEENEHVKHFYLFIRSDKGVAAAEKLGYTPYKEDAHDRSL